MGSATRVALVQIVLTAGVCGLPTYAIADEGVQAVIELRLMTYAALDPTTVHIATQTAEAVLASAGIQTTWRLCGWPGDGCAGPGRQPFVLVQLLPIKKMADPSISGEVVRDPTTKIPAILVYVSRNQELAQTIQRSGEGRSHPALATLAPGHLVGLTIAHEVGHVLGLSHTGSGVMKARLSTKDILASRTSLPVFRKKESNTMRQGLRASTLPGPARAPNWD